MDCATCSHPSRREIERQHRAGVPTTTLATWTRDHPPTVSRIALGRHLRNHLGDFGTTGRRPVSGDLLDAIIDDAHGRLDAGEIRASLKDGIAATKAKDARAARAQERDLMLKIAIALTGSGSALPALPDPERDIQEAEFRALLNAGDA